MVKTKERRTGKVPVTKSGTPHFPNDLPDCDNQQEDGGWVLVKKQRVTILVPAAPHSKRSSNANRGSGEMHPETASNRMQLPVETSGNHPSSNVALAASNEVHAVGSSPSPLPKATSAKQPRANQTTELQNPHQGSILKSHKLLGLSNRSKAIKQARTLLAPRRSCNLVVPLNQGLRASNLERKLERAGGLRQWLTSLGLGQFVRIFHRKGLSKYQLVNLTMQKLKDMGAIAVGPRRKLIHAIDCVCQPYCFEAL